MVVLNTVELVQIKKPSVPKNYGYQYQIFFILISLSLSNCSVTECGAYALGYKSDEHMVVLNSVEVVQIKKTSAPKMWVLSLTHAHQHDGTSTVFTCIFIIILLRIAMTR